MSISDGIPGSKTASTTMIQGLNQALHEAMGEDGDVIVIGEDVADPEGGGVFKVTQGLSNAYGDSRVRSTPIAEQAIAGAGIGAALGGLRPVAEIMLLNFTTVAMDMMVNHAAKIRYMSGGQTSLPVTFITMTGAGLGLGGQHSDSLEAWFAHTAGIKVAIPSNPSDAYGLLKSCIEDPDPCLLIEPISLLRAKGPAVEDGYTAPLGEANTMKQGTDVTVVAYGRQALDSLAVADELEKDGVSVEVIDLRTISPLDHEAIARSVEKTGRLVIVHEAVVPFGVGAEIATVISDRFFGRLKAPVNRVGSAFAPVPYAKHLEEEFIPNRKRIRAGILETVNHKIA